MRRPQADRLTGRPERLVEDGPRTGRQDRSGVSECSCVSLDPELSGDQMAITSTRSSSPVKSSPLRVYRSRPLACAVAAIGELGHACLDGFGYRLGVPRSQHAVRVQPDDEHPRFELLSGHVFNLWGWIGHRTETHSSA